MIFEWGISASPFVELFWPNFSFVDRDLWFYDRSFAIALFQSFEKFLLNFLKLREANLDQF